MRGSRQQQPVTEKRMDSRVDTLQGTSQDYLFHSPQRQQRTDG